ncbi:MAG: hypothetical protein JJV98_17990 [Desulfosarcina sp.]|nr:hypothetical protein [Desulfobacterales bacterium]
MQRMALVDAQPGMILAVDVLNAQQMLLLKKGVALTDKNIKMLKSWGAPFINVESAPMSQPAAAAPDRPGILEAIETRMGEKFGPAGENEVMTEIRRVATAILIDRADLQDAINAD